jgi:RIO-like serine/threonine protein kinase
MKLPDVIKKFGGFEEEGKGSGKTKVIITPKFVIKIFPNSNDIEPEINILSEIDSKFIIKLVYFQKNPSILVYEKIKPLKGIGPNGLLGSMDNMIKLVCNISEALYDIHTKGYIHGDVAIGNIGLDSKNNYILFDFEDTIKTNSPEKRYKDVEMFLEDLIIQYKDYQDIKLVLINILEELRSRHTTREKMVKMILGRPKELYVYKYNYKPGDFGLVISDYCKLLGI